MQFEGLRVLRGTHRKLCLKGWGAFPAPWEKQPCPAVMVPPAHCLSLDSGTQTAQKKGAGSSTLPAPRSASPAVVTPQDLRPSRERTLLLGHLASYRPNQWTISAARTLARSPASTSSRKRCSFIGYPPLAGGRAHCLHPTAPPCHPAMRGGGRASPSP